MKIEITIPDDVAGKILNSFSVLCKQKTNEVLTPKESLIYLLEAYIDNVYSKIVLKAIESTRNILKTKAITDTKNIVIEVTQDIVEPEPEII